MNRTLVVGAIVASTSLVRAEGEPTVALFGGAVKIDVSRGWETEVLDGPRLRSTNAQQKVALYIVRATDAARLEPVKDCTPDEANAKHDLERDGWRGDEVEMTCASGDYSVARTFTVKDVVVRVWCGSTEKVAGQEKTFRTRCRDAFNRLHFAKAEEQVGAPSAADLARYTKDIPGTGKLVATLETSEGVLRCELFGDKAPATVANFVGLARGKKPWLNSATGAIERNKPYFDGLTFHRVIPDFMIQGGDPAGNGTGGPGYRFANEDNDRPMGPGALAMANAGPDTNGSQFFIMEGSRKDLEHHYTNFGQCEPLEVVSKIARVPRGDADKPNTAVVIKRVTFKKR